MNWQKLSELPFGPCNAYAEIFWAKWDYAAGLTSYAKFLHELDCIFDCMAE